MGLADSNRSNLLLGNTISQHERKITVMMAWRWLLWMFRTVTWNKECSTETMRWHHAIISSTTPWRVDITSIYKLAFYYFHLMFEPYPYHCWSVSSSSTNLLLWSHQTMSEIVRYDLVQHSLLYFYNPISLPFIFASPSFCSLWAQFEHLTCVTW